MKFKDELKDIENKNKELLESYKTQITALEA